MTNPNSNTAERDTTCILVSVFAAHFEIMFWLDFCIDRICPLGLVQLFDSCWVDFSLVNFRLISQDADSTIQCCLLACLIYNSFFVLLLLLFVSAAARSAGCNCHCNCKNDEFPNGIIITKNLITVTVIVIKTIMNCTYTCLNSQKWKENGK